MRHSLLTLILAGVLSTVSLAAHAIDESNVPEHKRTELGLYLTPEEAWNMISETPDQVLFLDVRTRAEAAIVGMPTPADGLVPFTEYDAFWRWDDERENYKIAPLQDFVPETERRLHEKGLGKEDAVIVMCRTGGRSAKAADRLAKAGYTTSIASLKALKAMSVKPKKIKDVAQLTDGKMPACHGAMSLTRKRSISPNRYHR